jgi:hypothetical protein
MMFSTVNLRQFLDDHHGQVRGVRDAGHLALGLRVIAEHHLAHRELGRRRDDRVCVGGSSSTTVPLACVAIGDRRDQDLAADITDFLPRHCPR